MLTHLCAGGNTTLCCNTTPDRLPIGDLLDEDPALTTCAGPVLDVSDTVNAKRFPPVPFRLGNAHWDGSDLRQRLEDEIADLRAAADFLIIRNGLDEDRIRRRAGDKLVLFEGWHREHGDGSITGAVLGSDEKEPQP